MKNSTEYKPCKCGCGVLIKYESDTTVNEKDYICSKCKMKKK